MVKLRKKSTAVQWDRESKMAVDFCDYFWGEKHDGYHVLHQNLKAGFMATKDLAETLRENALIQENNSKVEFELLKRVSK